MGSFLNLNFVFENNKETFNGSPRYSYRGPLYNYVIKSGNYTENLELSTEENNILFFEIRRGEFEFKRIVKEYKDWIIENNINIILANIADPTLEYSYLHLLKIIEKSGLKNYIHFIDTNINLENYDRTQTFDFFIEEIISYGNRIENELFGYGSKNDLGYVSKPIYEAELDTFRNKKFLSFNRILSTKYHRAKLFLDSIKFNLHNDSYFSFLQNNDFGDSREEYFTAFRNGTEYKDGFVNDCISKLPIQLDMGEYNGDYNTFRTHNTFKKELFLDSCINIVTETSFQFNELFLSEKILKPIIMYQPFIVLSSVHYLKRLQKLGFKTFDEFWDESYDNIDDYEERYKKILLLILELNNKSIEELNNLYKSLKHICIYNRNHLLKMKKNSWPTIMSNISNSFYKITTKQKDKSLL
tara:strand:+ start:10992 stop:12233 length:1242 start_codon:yes stop_codon:yes gene_type:complete